MAEGTADRNLPQRHQEVSDSEHLLHQWVFLPDLGVLGDLGGYSTYEKRRERQAVLGSIGLKT